MSCGWAALAVALVLGGNAAAQDLPAGTHSVDDHAREDAAAAQVREAEAALEQGNFPLAETKLKLLAAARPKDARVLFDLGFAEEHNGEEDAAAKSYAAAMATDATIAEPKLALGLLDARHGRLDAAHQELTAVAKMTTAAPETRGRALRALAVMDEVASPEAAREELLAALQLTAETPEDIRMGAELAERAGDDEDAEAAYRRALAKMPGDLRATVGLVHVLRLEKKTLDAEAVLTAALKQHPGDPELSAQMAEVYAAEGKTAEAIALLEQLRKADPTLANDAAMGRMLGRLYAISGDQANAEQIFAALAAADPKDPYLLDDLGSAEVKLAQFGPAEATLTRAAALREAFHDDEAWGETETHLAFAASHNNDPTVVLQALAARATVLPNSAASLFLQATAHDSLHHTREAVTAYRAFLAVANGKYPEEELQARHRLAALEPKQ